MDLNKKLIVWTGLFFFLVLVLPSSGAAVQFAQITSFKGEVLVLAGTRVDRVEKTGHALNEGDRVQTKDGDAEITFEDGAIIQMSPFSTSMIQQKEEETGFWIFKKKSLVRRITVYIGKLNFKSGSDIKHNYMQTPTATAGVRGSEVDVGYDAANSYLNLISGEISAQFGEFVQGYFDAPGSAAALQSEVFQAIEEAAAASDEAAGDTLKQAQAELAVLEAIKAAAEDLIQNADPAVAQEFRDVLTAVEAQITQQQTAISEIAAPPPTQAIPLPQGTQRQLRKVIRQPLPKPSPKQPQPKPQLRPPRPPRRQRRQQRLRPRP